MDSEISGQLSGESVSLLLCWSVNYMLIWLIIRIINF